MIAISDTGPSIRHAKVLDVKSFIDEPYVYTPERGKKVIHIKYPVYDTHQIAFTSTAKNCFDHDLNAETSKCEVGFECPPIDRFDGEHEEPLCFVDISKPENEKVILIDK